MHLELDLVASVKGCKRAFNRHISEKGRSREIPTAEWGRRLGDKDMEKAKIINGSFALVCVDDIWILETKASETSGKVSSNDKLPSVKKNQDREYLNKLNE